MFDIFKIECYVINSVWRSENIIQMLINFWNFVRKRKILSTWTLLSVFINVKTCERLIDSRANIVLILLSLVVDFDRMGFLTRNEY